MARSAASPVVDVPITFRERVAGESKLSMSQNIDYVLQLMALYWARYKVLMVLIILVGLYALKTMAAYAGLM